MCGFATDLHNSIYTYCWDRLPVPLPTPPTHPFIYFGFLYAAFSSKETKCHKIIKMQQNQQDEKQKREITVRKKWARCWLRGQWGQSPSPASRIPATSNCPCRLLPLDKESASRIRDIGSPVLGGGEVLFTGAKLPLLLLPAGSLKVHLSQKQGDSLILPCLPDLAVGSL